MLSKPGIQYFSHMTYSVFLYLYCNIPLRCKCLGVNRPYSELFIHSYGFFLPHIHTPPPTSLHPFPSSPPLPVLPLYPLHHLTYPCPLLPLPPAPQRGSPAPALNPASHILHMSHMTRPFTLMQLRELLSEDGPIIKDGFWTNKIKSHCIAVVSAVCGVVWVCV